ncbi:MAG: hypothetical protein ACR2JY_24205 [Chloroflexota bacterium]
MVVPVVAAKVLQERAERWRRRFQLLVVATIVDPAERHLLGQPGALGRIVADQDLDHRARQLGVVGSHGAGIQDPLALLLAALATEGGPWHVCHERHVQCRLIPIPLRQRLCPQRHRQPLPHSLGQRHLLQVTQRFGIEPEWLRGRPGLPVAQHIQHTAPVLASLICPP